MSWRWILKESVFYETSSREPEMEPTRIRVGVITEPGSAHLDLYLPSFANCPEVEEVALADKTGMTLDEAGVFFAKSPVKFRTFRDPVAMLKSVKPGLALVT